MVSETVPSADVDIFTLLDLLHARPDCEIFPLMDENLHEKLPGSAPSNFWNFKLPEGEGHEFDLRVSLKAGFTINANGIILWPRVHGSFLSATDRLPNFRMFKTLVESDKDAPVVAKELAASDGNIVVIWADLGLDGIRRITDLFSEFAGQNEAIMRLDRSQEVFDPNPNPLHQQPGDKLFVSGPAQPRVIQVWRTQLNEHRACLVV
jgi:hypothetical protein